MTVPFPEPTAPVTSRAEMLLDYLDFYRATVRAKLAGLSDDQLRTSRLPSGWAPLALLKHLVHVERRWLVWGFAGEPVPDPWGDTRDDRWFLTTDDTLPALTTALDAQAARTCAIVAAHELDDVGAPGPRWQGAPPATLERVLLHVIQEYARHAGQLDVVRELLDGTTGE